VDLCWRSGKSVCQVTRELGIPQPDRPPLTRSDLYVRVGQKGGRYAPQPSHRRADHRLPAPKGLDVDSGLKGFALSSPRSSAWTVSGSNSRRTKRRTCMMAPPGGAFILVFGWARRQARFAGLPYVHQGASSADGGLAVSTLA
jgi:hypothetical protein